MRTDPHQRSTSGGSRNKDRPGHQTRGDLFWSDMSKRSALEDDLVTRRRAPGSTAPAFGRKRRRSASANAAVDEDLEIGERHAAALLFPDRAKREDRVERVVAVHA